jgi:hypothetical protein
LPEFLRSLASEVREDAFKELSFRWRELRAVEIVAAEISETFDGEDPLPADVRQRLDACKRRAQGYLEQLEKKRLPEPSEDFLARAQALIDEGFAALGLAEELR